MTGPKNPLDDNRHFTSGRIKHTCVECKTAWYPQRRELIRAAGISCPGCGSRFYDVSQPGLDKLADAADAQRIDSARVDRRMGK